jgi:replicative DNA helicase
MTVTTPPIVYSPPDPYYPPDDTPAAPTVPHSREAEEAVVGSVLVDPDSYFGISRIATADDFYIHRLRWIWETFGELVTSRSDIDILTVADRLERRGQLADVGGQSFLISLVNACPSTLNAENYAQAVRDYAERRKGIALANQIANAAYRTDEDFSLGEYSVKLAQAARGQSRRTTTDEAASQMIDMVLNPQCMTTGIKDVDNAIGGMFAQELSILAGYQGTGKSTVKIQAARANADAGKRVLFCDLEMSAAQTWFKIACGDNGIDMNKVRTGKIATETQSFLNDYACKLADHYRDNLIIYEAPMTPADIMAAVMIEKPDITFVDTLRDVGGRPRNESLSIWYDSVISFLRVNVAKATRSHVQVLHHINRGPEKDNRRPTKHDLMYGGESAPDMISILWRKEEGEPTPGIIRTVAPVIWITEKSRFGWTGDTEINFNLTRQSFYGMTRRDDEEIRNAVGAKR